MMRINAFRAGIFLLLAIPVAPAFAQKNSQDVLTHKVIVNHDKGTVVAYVKPLGKVNLKTDRNYYWFANHEIKSTQGGYNGKLLNGDYLEYDHHKTLIESGEVDAGLKTDIWKNWNAEGKLVNDYTWQKGRRNGIYHTYDSLGRTIVTGKYRNDLLHGKQLTVVSDSTQKVYYKNGKVVQRKPFIPVFITRFFKKIF